MQFTDTAGSRSGDGTHDCGDGAGEDGRAMRSSSDGAPEVAGDAEAPVIAAGVDAHSPG
jgi:hypothetical protein